MSCASTAAIRTRGAVGRDRGGGVELARDRSFHADAPRPPSATCRPASEEPERRVVATGDARGAWTAAGRRQASGDRGRRAVGSRHAARRGGATRICGVVARALAADLCDGARGDEERCGGALEVESGRVEAGRVGGRVGPPCTPPNPESRPLCYSRIRVVGEYIKGVPRRSP
jgi:hypothetical protein